MKMQPRIWPCTGVLCILTFFTLSCRQQPSSIPQPSAGITHLLIDKELQNLGEKIFFDPALSTPPGQACASCHSSEVGWTGPDEELNKRGSVYPGAVHTRFGNRKPNASAYATFTPQFHGVLEGETMTFVGGDFWDGRATGWKLGNPAADQAQGPFLNPVEQNNGDPRVVMKMISQSAYASQFKEVAKRIWGIDDAGTIGADLGYGIVAIAIAAFEHSHQVNQFSSKYDAYLKGNVSLTEEEKEGLLLFEGKAKCANCHPSRTSERGEGPLFTDFKYDNIGVPRNPDNPWYKMPAELNPQGEKWVDPGLAGFLQELPQYAMYARENLGKHRAPTLRNVDLRPNPSFVKAYGHNGYFKSLEAVVHFYNTRDVLPQANKVADPQVSVNCWPAPEVAENLNASELGNLGLSPKEEAAIVAFLKTLSDGYKSK